VDRGVIAAATELFEARHYPGVIAMCADALDGEPGCVPLLLIRARARIALRQDAEAQADLREVARIDPTCGLAFRLLGEIAARRSDRDAAAVFFRVALRIDPSDRDAGNWLRVHSGSSTRPAAAVELPALAAEAGRVTSTLYLPQAPRTTTARLARGTQPPPQLDDRPTNPYVRLGVSPRPADPEPAMDGLAPAPAPMAAIERTTLAGRPLPHAPRALPRPSTAPGARSPASELPGFGEYLVARGILTRERLRAAEAYQRSMKVQLATAIVTLGLASPQRVELAAVAHQSQLPRDRAAT
jgi:tetratricopeptide (TPR) repeat protein